MNDLFYCFTCMEYTSDHKKPRLLQARFWLSRYYSTYARWNSLSLVAYTATSFTPGLAMKFCV